LSYRMQWPPNTSPEWLLEKIQRMELLVIRARQENEQALLRGNLEGLFGTLEDLEASHALGKELEELVVKLGGDGHVCVYLLCMIHNMLSQETVDLEKVCRAMRFAVPQKKILTSGTAQSLSALDLFLDNAERESE
jgi:hypothetical protein